MTANSRRNLSLAVWVAMLAMFAAGAIPQLRDARHPVAACVAFAIVLLGGAYCALRDYFAAPFDDARFDRRINKQLSRNAERGEAR